MRSRSLALLLLIPVLAGAVEGHGEEDPGAERHRGFGAVGVDGVRPGMVPFVLPWDDGTPGPTDLSFLNHRPAGKYGYLTAREDGDLYAGEDRIRCFGVNLCFGAAVPAKERAPGLAARLAKFGVNVVRFHHIDNARALLPHRNNSRDFDPAAEDRLDFLINELKQRGIYSNLNLLVSRKFQEADGAGPLHLVSGKMQSCVGMWHEPAFALHAEYARRLLGHRNPYTGLTYAEDPAVAFIEILNENGLANTWLSPERTAAAGNLAELPPELTAPLLERWRRFTAGRHGDTAQILTAWGEPADSDLVRDGELQLVPLEQLTGFQRRSLTLRTDWLTFLREVERDYYRRMAAVIKEDLHCRALVAGSTLHSGWPTVMAEMDWTDGHVYWENPSWRKGTWDYAGREWHIGNQSHCDAGPAGRLRWIAAGQIRGKPFGVTEFNHSAPNVFAGEAPLYLAAHAAIQGWDCPYLFAYSHSDRFDSGMLMGLDTVSHPTKMANLTVAALIFRRGDLGPARSVDAGWMNREREVEIVARQGRSWNLAHAHHVGVAPPDTVRRRCEMVVAETEPAGLTGARPDEDHTLAITSDTGELTWDDADPRGGVTIVDTARTKSVFGMIAERRFALGAVEIISGKTMDGGGCISVCLLEGDSFSAAGRALIVATARAENTGMLWKKVLREGSPGQIHWELDHWGRAPTTVEVVTARIGLPGSPATVTAYRLDERGQRAGEIPLRPLDDHRVGLHLGLEHRTLWYEVVWRR
jgi:hypothetical protein